MSKSKMESIYEQYISCSDSILLIDNSTYFKIVCKNDLVLNEGNIVTITLPNTLFGKEKFIRLKDENDRYFSLTPNPLHYSFRETPDWYINTLTFIVLDVQSSDLIGEYVTPIYQVIMNDDDKAAAAYKMEHPNETVRCPRCGKRLVYDEDGNSASVTCPTIGCIRGSIRGI